MNKEEILKRSRTENKNQDVYEKEVTRDAANYGACAAGILATIFFIVQIFVGGGMNYGLYAVVFAIPAAGFIYKAIRLRRRHEILVAIVYTVATLMFSAAHLYNLITSSAIL